MSMVFAAIVARNDAVGFIGAGTLHHGYAPKGVADGDPDIDLAMPSLFPATPDAHPVPYIRLDTGDIVWGTECFWVPWPRWERMQVKLARKGIPIIPMTIEQLRSAISL